MKKFPRFPDLCYNNYVERYQQIPHTADIAARIYGHTMEELYANAAFAMFDMAADLSKVSPDLTMQILAGGEDREDLLVSWLNELLYKAFTANVVFSRFEVSFPRENIIKAIVAGSRGVGLKREIKAATYHNVEISRTDQGYEVTIVFDV